jgi:hypothetical protein
VSQATEGGLDDIQHLSLEGYNHRRTWLLVRWQGVFRPVYSLTLPIKYYSVGGLDMSLPNKEIIRDEEIALMLDDGMESEKHYKYSGGEVVTLDVTKLLHAQQQADFKTWAKYLANNCAGKKDKNGIVAVRLCLTGADYAALQAMAEGK